MFTIKKKPLTPNIIWDASTGKPLCNFGHKGMISTNDRDLADKLAALGHEVTGEADAPARSEQPGDGAENTQAEGTAASDPEKEPQAEQLGKTAEASAEQAAAPAAKGKGSRK